MKYIEVVLSLLHTNAETDMQSWLSIVPGSRICVGRKTEPIT